ncbi:hypothetical protein DESUT3_21440 [Desulfuromonas versatilis]|uniref:Peptidase C39 domain-containing protein n=1 Tax=Desulfuromonas versatilis TaxID=2802975 RepID=A0ABM8HQ14_9BACT|nr:C39 family peptidase [Desulfuromonas versatilis]BCR05075.1 hypothetical protein DESUT3_21440 [Desulfuromonas versatilis]
MLVQSVEVHAAAVDIRIGNMVVSKKVKSMKDLRFENLVRQTTDFSCGAASLATILTFYFDRETSEEDILQAVLTHQDPQVVERVKKSGLSLLDLKNYAESLGFGGKGYQLEVTQLRELDRPAIVLINHQNYNHFVVVKGISGDKVHIADPAKGNMVKSLKEFQEMWNGILLAFTNSTGEKVEEHALAVKQGLRLDRKLLVPDLFNMDLVKDPSEF